MITIILIVLEENYLLEIVKDNYSTKMNYSLMRFSFVPL